MKKLTNVGAYNLDENSFPPHFRMKGGSGGSGGSASAQQITATCGEDVFKGAAVYFTAAGKIYKATPTLPADAVTLAAGDEDELAPIANSRAYATIDGASFASGDYGKPCYLVSGAPNISVTPPSDSSGNYIQKIGIVVDTDRIFVEVGEPLKIE